MSRLIQATIGVSKPIPITWDQKQINESINMEVTVKYPVDMSSHDFRNEFKNLAAIINARLDAQRGDVEIIEEHYKKLL